MGGEDDAGSQRMTLQPCPAANAGVEITVPNQTTHCQPGGLPGGDTGSARISDEVCLACVRCS